MISSAAIYVFHLNISTTASLMLLFGMFKNLSPRDCTSHILIKFYYLGLEGHMNFISINNTSKRNEICFGTQCKNKFQATDGNSCFHRESSKLGRP